MASPGIVATDIEVESEYRNNAREGKNKKSITQVFARSNGILVSSLLQLPFDGFPKLL